MSGVHHGASCLGDRARRSPSRRFVPLHGCVIFCCVRRPPAVYPPACGWTCESLLPVGDFASCCCEHGCADISLGLGFTFFWLATCGWTCRVVWAASLLGEAPNCFHDNHTISHPRQQSTRAQALHILANAHCSPPDFFFYCKVLILICLTSTDVEHFITCVSAVCTSSLEKRPSRSFAHFLNGFCCLRG